MATATPQDVYDRMPPGMEHPPEAYVQTLLNDAERTLLAKCAGLLARADLPTSDPTHVDPALIVQVEAAMVLRLLGDPEGYAAKGYVSETDGNYSYRLSDSASSPDRLAPTDDELGLLGCPGAGGMGIIALKATPPSGWPWWGTATPYIHPDEVTPDRAFQLYSLRGDGGDMIGPGGV